MNILTKAVNHVKKNWTSTGTIIFIVAGLIVGNAIRMGVNHDRPISAITLKYLSILPTLFIRCLLLVIVPFLVASLSTSLLVDDQTISQQSTSCVKSARQLITLTLAFFVSFLAIVTIFGISLVLIFSPGRFSSIGDKVQHVELSSTLPEVKAIQRQFEKSTKQLDSILNILLNLFPSNFVSTLFQTTQSQTTLVWPSNQSKILEQDYRPEVAFNVSYRDSPNLLGICLLSLLLGGVLQSLGFEKTKTIRSVLYEVNNITEHLLYGVMQTLPVVMFVWMVCEGLKMGNIEGMFNQLAYFLVIVFFAFVTIYLVLYPLAYYIFLRKNPYPFYRNLLEPITVALGSSSSAMTLPFTMKAMEEKAGLDKNICKFVLPLGMTIHMNGTSMYHSMMAIFISQVKGRELDFTSVFLTGVMIILISMSLPGTTGGHTGLILIFETVLNMPDAMGVLGYVLAVDFIVERVRTMTNITGDCFVAICIQSILTSQLENESKKEVELNEISTIGVDGDGLAEPGDNL